MTLQSIHLLASRHRLATLIASGALLLAAAPAAAHHPSSAPGHEATSVGALDSASDEVDGWQAGEFDRVGGSTDPSTGSGSVQTEQGGTTQGTTPSKDQADEANDGDSAGAEDATDTESTTGGDFEHSGTSDHGRPHPEDGSDGSSTWQGSTPNG